MADSFVQVATDGSGKKLDTEQLTVGANTVERERIQVAGAGATSIAAVTTATPASTEWALVVREVAPSQLVSGTVQVSGSVTITPTTFTVNTAGPSVSVVGTVTITPTTFTVNTAGPSVSVVGTVTITPTTLTVNTAATIAGASVTIQGSITAVSPYTTTAIPAISATGNIIWMAGSVYTTALPAGGAATGLIVWCANPTTVTVTGTGLLGTAIAFSYTTAVAGTVLTTLLMNIALNYTSGSTANYVVPAGKVLRLLGVNAMVQNTLASIGIARGDFFVVAATSATAGSTSPVYGYLGIAAATSATGQRGYGQLHFGPGLDFSAGVTMAFNMFVSGASSQGAAWIVHGVLLP